MPLQVLVLDVIFNISSMALIYVNLAVVTVITVLMLRHVLFVQVDTISMDQMLVFYVQLDMLAGQPALPVMLLPAVLMDIT